MNLTHEQRNKINEFIAEKCGWTQIESTLPGIPYWRNPDGYYEGGGTYNPIPDYCASLDACHEAENLLLPLSDANYSIRNHYADKLGSITMNDNGRGWQPLSNADCFKILHATAEQRAIALFQTLGGQP